MTEDEEKGLLLRVDDMQQAILHMFCCLTGQRVDELKLRVLIERLGASTHTKLPPGVKL